MKIILVVGAILLICVISHLIVKRLQQKERKGFLKVIQTIFKVIRNTICTLIALYILMRIVSIISMFTSD